MPTRKPAALGFIHDFSRLPVNVPPVAPDDCSLSLASPRACPFGSACHTCPARVQAKLAVNQPGDIYEQDADRVAEAITRTTEFPLLQRKCTHCGDEDEEKLQRKDTPGQESESELQPEKLAGVDAVLQSHGQQLDVNTRAFMEARFNQDFSQVRIHTDAHAAASVRAVNALAYTVGRDIAFGAGRYVPETHQGRQLIAHELAHVLQQRAQPASRMTSTFANAVKPALLQRQIAPRPAESTPESDPVRLQQLDQLLSQITAETSRSISLRYSLDTLPAGWSLRREMLEAGLNQSRTNLIGLLEQRIGLLRAEIAGLNTRIGPNPASIAGRPETSDLGYERNRRQAELRQHEQQLRPLRLWQTRRELEAMPAQIDQINREILALPPMDPRRPASEMNDPRVQELMARRAQLEERQRHLASTLTSSAIRYRQGDPRWGARRYGTSPQCTNVAAAGCGPTSLAMLLNYLFQEDPEVAAGGDLELVRPPQTAEYAATHGRICNSGTSGDTMVTNVHTQWPGFHGSRISLEQAVTTLRSGNLVIFLCRNCQGQNSAGQNKTYGGHFMVLNGVNAEASQFNVLDSAGHNIVRISRNELRVHTAGFWTVARK